MKNYINISVMLVFVLLFSACATNSQKTASDPSTAGIQTEEKADVSEQGDMAASVTISRATVSVTEIDKETRMVTLSALNGSSFAVKAGEEVKNFDQIKVGDYVVAEYYEGVVADLKLPTDTSTDVELAEAMVAAEPGMKPAAAVGNAYTETVVIEEVDTGNNVVKFRGATGISHVVDVKKPEFRKMLKTLKTGDRVNLTFFESLAIRITPANN